MQNVDRTALEDALFMLRHAESPLVSLRALALIGMWAEGQKTDQVAIARQQGNSWAEVAEALQITRQAAHRRYR
jgi:hypothetical protein